MYVFALAPLSIYFFCLFVLNRRRNPCALNGGQDFSLLAFGLFGFVSLSAGKWLVPLNLMTFWGSTLWLFWTAFYFAAVHIAAQCLTHRLVLYHCPRQWFAAEFVKHLQTIDAAAQLNGSVLSLPRLNIQCLLTGDRFGGHTLLVPTEPAFDKHQRTQWKTLTETVNNFCPVAEPPRNNTSLFWGAATIGTSCLTAVELLHNGTALFISVWDLWGIP